MCEYVYACVCVAQKQNKIFSINHKDMFYGFCIFASSNSLQTKLVNRCQYNGSGFGEGGGKVALVAKNYIEFCRNTVMLLKKQGADFPNLAYYL